MSDNSNKPSFTIVPANKLEPTLATPTPPVLKLGSAMRTIFVGDNNDEQVAIDKAFDELDRINDKIAFGQLLEEGPVPVDPALMEKLRGKLEEMLNVADQSHPAEIDPIPVPDLEPVTMAQLIEQLSDPAFLERTITLEPLVNGEILAVPHEPGAVNAVLEFMNVHEHDGVPTNDTIEMWFDLYEKSVEGSPLHRAIEHCGQAETLALAILVNY